MSRRRTTPAQRAAFTVGHKVTVCSVFDPEIYSGVITQDRGEIVSVKTNAGTVTSAQRCDLHKSRE